eukprot:1138800-Pelagomonas_calceolata.AAC.2
MRNYVGRGTLPTSIKEEKEGLVGIWSIARSTRLQNLAVMSILFSNCAPSGYKFVSGLYRMCMELTCELASLLMTEALSFELTYGMSIITSLTGAQKTVRVMSQLSHKHPCKGPHAAAVPLPCFAKPCVFTVLDFNQVYVPLGSIQLFLPPCAEMYQHQAYQPSIVAASPFFQSARFASDKLPPQTGCVGCFACCVTHGVRRRRKKKKEWEGGLVQTHTENKYHLFHCIPPIYLTDHSPQQRGFFFMLLRCPVTGNLTELKVKPFWVAEGVRGAVTGTDGVHVTPLLYADDLTLTANAPNAMQTTLGPLCIKEAPSH